MSLDRCIPGLVEEGQLTPEQGARALEIYGRRKRHHGRAMGDEAAAALASEDAAREIEFAAQELRRHELLTRAVQKRTIVERAQYRGDGSGAAAIALLVRDELAPYSNVEYRWKAVRGEAHSLLDGLLMKHRRDLLGRVRNPADLDDFVRELYGLDTGNLSAKELAAAWTETAEMLRRRFNAAGGSIGKLDRWGLPQSHDSVLVGEAGFDAWVEFIWPKLDRARMTDVATGQPFDDETLRAVLAEVFATISSDGWSKRNPGGMGGGKLASQRAEHRFLHFASPDDWLAYQGRFGGGTAFDAMMNHIDGMSRDIALMEVLGPNPAATVKWLVDALKKEAALSGGRGKRRLFGARQGRLVTDQARMDANIVQQVFDEVMGKYREPHNRELALAFSAIRSWQVTTKLGSAVLSTTSDQATQILTRRFNGIPVVGMMQSQLKMLNPLDDGDRRFAIRSMLIAEEASQIGSAQARYTGEVLTGEISRRMAELTLRVSGLNAVTQGGRWAFGMDFLSAVTSESVKAWDRLDPPFRIMLDRYGLGAADWDRLRSTPIEEARGAHWILPGNIEDPQLRTRLLEMILTETDFAVPTPGLRVRATINARAKPGTWLGELLRTGFQFKSFPVTVLFMQANRIMAQQGWNRARYAASMVVLMTAAGALATWMKDVSKGKDPRRADGEFLLEAFAQGGGGGIYGDFLRSSRSRFGSGFDETLKGPAWQLGATVFEDLTVDPAIRALQGEAVNYGARVNRAARSNVPVVGSLFYTRLAFEREMLDTMQSWIDPDYRSSWRRTARRAERDYGQEFFWPQGEAAPDRAPDFSNILEGAPQ